jgi:hypothetical protein
VADMNAALQLNAAEAGVDTGARAARLAEALGVIQDREAIHVGLVHIRLVIRTIIVGDDQDMIIAGNTQQIGEMVGPERGKETGTKDLGISHKEAKEIKEMMAKTTITLKKWVQT